MKEHIRYYIVSCLFPSRRRRAHLRSRHACRTGPERQSKLCACVLMRETDLSGLYARVSGDWTGFGKCSIASVSRRAEIPVLDQPPVKPCPHPPADVINCLFVPSISFQNGSSRNAFTRTMGNGRNQIKPSSTPSNQTTLLTATTMESPQVVNKAFHHLCRTRNSLIFRLRFSHIVDTMLLCPSAGQTVE